MYSMLNYRHVVTHGHFHTRHVTLTLAFNKHNCIMWVPMLLFDAYDASLTVLYPFTYPLNVPQYSLPIPIL